MCLNKSKAVQNNSFAFVLLKQLPAVYFFLFTKAYFHNTKTIYKQERIITYLLPNVVHGVWYSMQYFSRHFRLISSHHPIYFAKIRRRTTHHCNNCERVCVYVYESLGCLSLTFHRVLKDYKSPAFHNCCSVY